MGLKNLFSRSKDAEKSAEDATQLDEKTTVPSIPLEGPPGQNTFNGYGDNQLRLQSGGSDEERDGFPEASGSGTGSGDHESDKDDLSIFVGDDDAFDIMAEHLYNKAATRGWFSGSESGGMVSIRQEAGTFKTFPKARQDYLNAWHASISPLDPEVIMEINSKVTRMLLATLDPEATEVRLDSDTKIQVVDSLIRLPRARKYQYAAFLRGERSLVVWNDEVENLLTESAELVDKMLQYLWAQRNTISARTSRTSLGQYSPRPQMATRMSSMMLSEVGTEPIMGPLLHEKQDAEAGLTEKEKAMKAEEDRPTMLHAAIITGLAVILDMVLMGLGIGTLLREYMLDGNATRFALVAVLPFVFVLALYFCIFIIGSLWQTFGPIAQCKTNSKYYSGKAPTLRPDQFTSFTVQIPVYKEGLESVIIPTVESIKKAVSTYERQGGAVSILVCDDGLQLIDEEQALARKEFYRRNGLAWVARPPHGHLGFNRAGRFKKASNMNYALSLSMRVEDIMEEFRQQQQGHQSWSPDDDELMYEEALAQALGETGGMAWASGDIRVQELILIVDSDTRVPSDCFMSAAAEFSLTPELAILQHESAVLKVVGHFFENAIAHFTNRINKAISFSCAGGQVAAFVGHNAFLRWSAIQDVAFETDGVLKFWSESHVSEDFDMALRLQMAGYTLRWATYHDGGFKEGVSLTCGDELNRWQKYAYGCSELIFQPFRFWFTRGPISKLFRVYIWSDIPIYSKIATLGYISSYYAIAISLVMSLVNYIIVGLFDFALDGFYLSSWQVFLACIVIFIGLSNVSSAVSMYRLKECGLFEGFLLNFKWLIFFFFFFSGMSWHLTTALLAHLFSYNIVWEATIKEVELSNFWKEVPSILRRFWKIFTLASLIIAGIIIMSTSLVPVGWRITTVYAILPIAIQAGAHVGFPLILNPWLMHFHF